MDDSFKIKQLWQYLKIQDNEVLIVQLYNDNKKIDELLVVEKVCGKLEAHTVSSLQILHTDKPFRLIQMRDSFGKHRFPSVERLKHDKSIDY